MRNIGLLVLFIVTLLTAGCVTKPIQNIAAEPVVTSSGNTPTLENVTKAIIRAGVALGWTMKPIEPGYILGTLNLREHTAVVDIRYTVKTYSITYKDSSNLQYDGTNIHKNYNSWIQNLDKRIQGQLINL